VVGHLVSLAVQGFPVSAWSKLNVWDWTNLREKLPSNSCLRMDTPILEQRTSPPFHRTESQNILSWKGPTRIIKSSSTQDHSKTRPYVWQHCPDASWAPANAVLRPLSWGGCHCKTCHFKNSFYSVTEMPAKKKKEREKKFLLEHTFKISFYPFFLVAKHCFWSHSCVRSPHA